MRKNKEYFETYFDNYSPEEGNEWGINWRMSQIKRMENAAKLLTPALKKKELSVLEAGCATGDMTKVILNKINSLKCYDAFDISEKAIRICKASGMNQVNWITCGFNEMDFDTDKYDLIMCCEAIYYLPFYEQKECIKKLYSYLKKGGHLFISMNYVEYNKNFDTLLSDFGQKKIAYNKTWLWTRIEAKLYRYYKSTDIKIFKKILRMIISNRKLMEIFYNINERFLPDKYQHIFFMLKK